MPRIIAISSQKGGVGKTTVSINLAAAWAKAGRRVLLVDGDAQGGVARSLSTRATRRRGVQEILRGRARLPQLILTSKIPQLLVLPAGNCGLDADPPAAAWTRLLEQLRETDAELVLIDCQPGLNDQVRAILAGVDHQLVPQQCEPLSLRSLVPFVTACVKACGDRSRFAGVLLNMIDSQDPRASKLAAELRQMLPPGLLLGTEIPRDPDVVEASRQGLPLLFLGNPPPPAAVVFDQLALELSRRLKLDSPSLHESVARILD